MCLDVNYIYNNQKNMKEVKGNRENCGKIDSGSDFPIKCLCGGNLIKYPPVFDPNGGSIYVVWNDKVRVYSVETGECVRDLDDNKDGEIVGLSVSQENKKSLIACTTSGTVVTWKLDSFVILGKLKLSLPESSSVESFIITSVDGEPHGIVLYKDSQDLLKVALFELKKGKIVQNYQISFKNDDKTKLADGNLTSNFFVVMQKFSIFVIDKKSSKFIKHDTKIANNVIACHPEDEIIATGEMTGAIRLWRNIFTPNPVKTELHWHHMAVLSLAFSQSGTVLYSGGAECVLVKWQIKERTIEKDFLPRLSGSIKQISVDPNHDKIAVATDDNAIQIINSNLKIQKLIQDFTRASLYDLGSSQPFPAGIVMNPRSNQLVMNGRIGHLQFFSTKTMKLLYNIDITNRNAIPRTQKVNIFSTEVTLVAFSIKWMATVETWSDKVNSSDLRLKFWQFLEDKQTYALHTQIEQAHEKEIFSIEFSGSICATAGRDRCIKIWSLESSEDVKNPKMIWLCIEELRYKDLEVRKIGFSQDSSLLAAGFGNILCVWDTVDFRLKCALSAPASHDGSTNRVLFSLPGKNKKIVENFVEKRRKIVDLMRKVIEDGSVDGSLVKNIEIQSQKRYFRQKEVQKISSKKLSKAEKETIFRRVLALPDLNFSQKIQILHSLHIYYKISSRVEDEVIDFISRTSSDTAQLYKSLHTKINQIRNHEKYKTQWRFKTWNMLSSKRNRKFVTVRKLLTHKIDEKLLEMKKAKENESGKFLPVKNLTQITNLVFCSEEFSHLCLVTTPEKLLIWNLLTLKLQGSFKIHTKFVTLDPLTNLVAAFTKYNELFVFHPSPAMTIHHQRHIPEIYSAIWVPRESPKVQSVNVNWQATSKLLILNQKQEVCCFRIPGDEDYEDAAPFMEISNGFTTNTPFAAMIAQKITDETTKDGNGVTRRIAVGGSGAVKDIINLSSHAMPPMRLLCKDFIGSMLSTQQQTKSQKSEFAEETVETMEISDDENEISQQDEKIIRRKAIEKETAAMRQQMAKKKEAVTNIESKMKSLKLDLVDGFEL